MDERNIELIEVNNAVRVVFTLKLGELTGRRYVELESPIYHFKKPTNDQWRVKFLSVFEGKNTDLAHYGYHYCNQKLVPAISLHIDARDRATVGQVYVYQVIASVHSRPELGVIGFQSRHVSQSYIKHPRMFSLDQLQHAAGKDRGGEVRVCFEISCYGEHGANNAAAGPSSSSTNVQTIDKSVALLNLFSFLEEGAYSDVSLRADGREFRAHKLILSAQSSVFAAMFQSGMQETRTGVIDVAFPAEVVEEMLRFMYTGRTVNLSTMPLQLFAAAHIYECEALQRLCKDYVCSNISSDNVTEVLEFAERYTLNRVAGEAMGFVSLHEDEVVRKKEFIGYLVERLKPDNVASCLEMAHRYRLYDFRESIVKFIAKNFALVMRDMEYRELYRANVHLVLEVDERLTRYMVAFN